MGMYFFTLSVSTVLVPILLLDMKNGHRGSFKTAVEIEEILALDAD